MNLIQVNTLDIHGGAARVAGMLHIFFKSRGHDSKLIVGTKFGSDPDTIELGFAVNEVISKLPLSLKLFYRCHELRHRAEMMFGLEDLGDPDSRHLINLLPKYTDIIQCHNLHGGYFDLRILPALSKRYPVVILMHDPWLLGGHCAHSFDCEKWMYGCDKCRYLDVQYSLKRDTARINWLRKKHIFDSCRLYVVTPSLWLMDRVDRSILKQSVVKSRVINNGVDQTVYCPGDKKKARADLGISIEDRVVIFAANGIRESIWKDYATMRAAVGETALALPEKTLHFFAVGESAPAEKIGPATITFVPYMTPEKLACYYQAADVYIHASRAENFPNTIIEALSCGTPVVATAVGGVAEQIKGLCYDGDNSGLNRYGLEDATGILTPVGDVAALSRALCLLLGTPEILLRLSESAARDARWRFNIEAIGIQYLDFFEEVIEDWKAHTKV